MPTEAAYKPKRRTLTEIILSILGVRKIDGYVLTELIGPFLGSFFFLVFVLLMFQVLRLAEFFIVHQIPGFLVNRVASLMILTYLPFSLPISVLIATLVAFGRLSADSEIIAMKSVGISLSRIVMPAVGFSLVVFAITLALNMEWVPWGERKLKEALTKISNTKVSTAVKEGTFTSGFFDLLIFANKIDPQSNRLQHVFIYDERDPENPQTIIAKEGQVVPVETEDELGSAALLRLFNGSTHSNKEDSKNYQKMNFGEQILYLEIEEADAAAVNKPRTWSYDKLMDQIKRTHYKGPRYRKLRTEYWRRVSIALSAAVFVFLGVGYGTIRTRAVRSGAIVVTTVVLFVYWFVLLWAIKIAPNTSWLPIPVTVNLPNILMAIAAVFSFKKASW